MVVNLLEELIQRVFGSISVDSGRYKICLYEDNYIQQFWHRVEIANKLFKAWDWVCSACEPFKVKHYPEQTISAQTPYFFVSYITHFMHAYNAKYENEEKIASIYVERLHKYQLYYDFIIRLSGETVTILCIYWYPDHDQYLEFFQIEIK